MNFGIADIDQQFGGHKRRYVCGMMIDQNGVPQAPFFR
jgi:hypothetical protein